MATWTLPVCLIVVKQEMTAWNEDSRQFMFLLKVTGESQRRYITVWTWMQCHAGGNVIFGHIGKSVSLVFLTASRQTQRTCAGVVSLLLERHVAKGDDVLLTGGTGDETWFHHQPRNKELFGSCLNHCTTGSCR